MVIGDVMVDAYLFGKVDRISPEAPVPVVVVQSRSNRPGGAANVALNIKGLGAEPVLCSVVGRDQKAASFRNPQAKRAGSSWHTPKQRPHYYHQIQDNWQQQSDVAR